MRSFVAILSLILAWIACVPVAAQPMSATSAAERDLRGQSNYLEPPAPPPAYPSTSPAPINDPQVRPATFQQPATAGPASSPAAQGTASPARPSGGLPLSPPSHKYDASTAAGHVEHGGMPSPITVAGSLAFVLGLFFLTAWVMRRATPGTARLLPKEVVEVLGRAPLASRQQMHLLRCGHKLVLVCATPAGVETLTEITDPLEVDRLAGMCQQTRADSATTMFRQVFEQLAETPRSVARRAASRAHDEVALANAGIAGGEADGVGDSHV